MFGYQAKVLQGVVPNQFGTWPFGRAGWCPGQHVDWWDVDVTSWLKSGENLHRSWYLLLFIVVVLLYWSCP